MPAAAAEGGFRGRDSIIIYYIIYRLKNVKLLRKEALYVYEFARNKRVALILSEDALPVFSQ